MAQKFLGIASLMTKKIVIELLKLKEAILLSQIILNSRFFFNFEKKQLIIFYRGWIIRIFLNLPVGKFCSKCQIPDEWIFQLKVRVLSQGQNLA